MVSPFCGGASVEINMAMRGCLVHASDIDLDLIRFWQEWQLDPEGIQAKAIKILERRLPHSKLIELLTDVSTPERYYLKNRLLFSGKMNRKSFSEPVFLEGVWYKKNRPNGRGDRIFPSQKNQVPFSEYQRMNWLRFTHRDAIESLSIFENCFAFCDPPYMCAKHYKHHNVSHEVLAETLRNRENWITTYGMHDMERIQYFYEGFKIVPIRLRAGMISKKHPNEVMILSHDLQGKIPQ